MATAKKQASKPVERMPKKLKPAVVGITPKKLTRKEKSAASKAAYRKLQKEEFAKADAHRHKTIKPPHSGGALVIHGDARKPTRYDPEIGKKICLMFATDPYMSLLVLNNDPTLPTVWDFYTWLHENPEFDKQYTRARELWCDLRAAQIVTASQQPLIGVVTTKRTGGKDGDTIETKEFDNVPRANLAIETQKWLLARERPKKYGAQPIESDSNNTLQELLNSFRARSAAIEDGGSE
jgi:hypothetical protein